MDYVREKHYGRMFLHIHDRGDDASKNTRYQAFVGGCGIHEGCSTVEAAVSFARDYIAKHMIFDRDTFLRQAFELHAILVANFPGHVS